jgi:hypothetical protein
MKNNNEKGTDYEEWESIVDKKYGWLKQNNTRPTIDYTKSVLGRMEEHEPDHGAVFCLAMGAPGSGKTGALLSCMDRTLMSFPKEKVFFNECFNTPLQVCKMGKNKYQFMRESDEIQFFDRSHSGKKIDPDVIDFTDFEDCYKKAKLGVVNVIFFKDRMKVIEFIGYLRDTCSWNHVFIDEMAEVAPAFASGEDWKRIEKFSFILKDIRKAWINVYSNVQSISDLDSRVRSKIMVRIFLPGSMKDKHSRIFQKSIDNLKEDRINGNEGYIKYFSRFCKTRFNKIYKPDPNNLIDARVIEKPKEKENE